MSIQKVVLNDAIDFKNGKALKNSNEGQYTVFGSNGPIGTTSKVNNENAIIIGRVGAYCGSVKVSEDKFWASDNTIVAKPKVTQDIFYWYYRLKSFPLRSFAGGSAQPLLTQNTLIPLQISAHTDLEEQKKISEIIKNYDDLIENNRRRIQLLEESARLLYKEWFVHLRFPGHEHVKITDGVPEGWESGAVIDFYKTSSGGTPSRKNLDFYTGDINWVKTGELLDSFIFTTEEKISEEAVSQSSAKIFPSGSVLVAMYGATIGRTGILAQPSSSNQACCALMPNHKLAHYIHAYLFLVENKAGLINLAKGAAQNNINQDIIKTFPMVMPPKLLMDIFYLSIKENFDQIRNLQQQNTKLIEARDILLPRLMNGDLAV